MNVSPLPEKAMGTLPGRPKIAAKNAIFLAIAVKENKIKCIKERTAFEQSSRVPTGIYHGIFNIQGIIIRMMNEIMIEEITYECEMEVQKISKTLYYLISGLVFRYYAFLFLNQGNGANALDRKLLILAFTFYFSENDILLSVLLNPIGIIDKSVSGLVWSHLKKLGRSDKFKSSFAAINEYLASDQGKKIPLIYCEFPAEKQNDGKRIVRDKDNNTLRNVESWLMTLTHTNSFVLKKTAPNTIRISYHHNSLRLYVDEIHTFYEVYGNGEKQFCVELKFVIGPHDAVSGSYEVKKFVHHVDLLERRLTNRKREFLKEEQENQKRSKTRFKKQKRRGN